MFNVLDFHDIKSNKTDPMNLLLNNLYGRNFII